MQDLAQPRKALLAARPAFGCEYRQQFVPVMGMRILLRLVKRVTLGGGDQKLVLKL